MIEVLSLDHLVLTVADVAETVSFYEKIGFTKEVFGEGRIALKFGFQKLNLHQAGQEIEPHAARATSGAADLCFFIDTPLSGAMEELAAAGVVVELGPVERTGASSKLLSVYFRDPDGNLIEFSNTLS